MQNSPDERGDKNALIEQVLNAIGQSLSERSEDELRTMLQVAEHSLGQPYSTFHGPSGQVMAYAHPDVPKDLVVRDLRAIARLLERLSQGTGQPN